MGSVGYGGYPDDQPTTALRADSGAGATSMLPPMSPDDGGYGYDDRPDRRRGQQRKSNTSTILLVVAGILVLVGAILIGRWAFSGNGAGDDTLPAPNFVGETEQNARKLATNSDLELTFSKKPCENQAKGNICTQNPKAGTDVQKGDTIALVVSTGAPKVAVPSVVGESLDDAKATLEGDKYQFVVETKTKESSEDPGTVLEQDPELGAEVEKGSTITLTVAKAEEKSTVPDVLGQSCDAAKQQMQASNLVGNCTEVETDDDNQVGKVIATTPQAGTSVDKNSSVTIQIGKKKEQQKTRVPQVVGQTVGQAKQTLAAAGFTNIQFANGSDQSDNALVAGQDPQGNQEVDDPASTTVTLQTVSFGNNGGTNNGGGGNGGIFGGLNGDD